MSKEYNIKLLKEYKNLLLSLDYYKMQERQETKQNEKAKVLVLRKNFYGRSLVV